MIENDRKLKFLPTFVERQHHKTPHISHCSSKACSSVSISANHEPFQRCARNC